MNEHPKNDSTSKTEPSALLSHGKADLTTSALKQGLMNLITPAVQECDERIQSVYKSQEELSLQIDILARGSMLSRVIHVFNLLLSIASYFVFIMNE
jgi:hypothetical protein